MSNSKLKIAVTGGIGSGKSTVCEVFKNHNYDVIKADDVAKELLQIDENIIEKVIKVFGRDCYDNSGLNKKYLAEKVFSSEENTRRINDIVHPAAIQKIKEMMHLSLERNNLVFVEAALIYEANMEDLFDFVLLVASADNDKISRVKKRDEIGANEIIKRLDKQIPDNDKKGAADFVLNNDGSLKDLISKSEFFLSLFEQLVKS